MIPRDRNMNQRLELNRNETFHRRDWMAQRIGWAVWAAVLGAALAGFAGPGPMSHRRISAPDNSLSISYDRFVRYHSRSTLELILRPKQATDTLPVHFNQGFIDAVEVHRIEPAPAASFLGKEGLVYFFQVEQGAQ